MKTKLILIAVIVIMALGVFAFLRQSKISIQPEIKDSKIRQRTVTVIDADWKQLRNDKYHYQINFPTTPKVVGEDDRIRIMYEDTSRDKPPFLASMDISLVGLLDEPIEKTALRLAPSKLFEKTTLNGYQAIKINYKDTYSENPAVSYGAILVRNSQNLNFLIRIDAKVDNEYKELLEKSIQTFQFVDQKNLVIPRELFLSGKVSMVSGDCMPTIGDGGGCSKGPISTTVLIYPLRTENSSFTEQNKLSPVTKTKSDKNGNYKVSIPPGTYSVYIDDNGKESCTVSDGYGNMCPITLYESDEERNILNTNHAAF